MDLALMKVAVADGIAVVTMDNPPVNAQNAQFNLEMAHVFDMLSDRSDVRVAVLTGAGKVFSAGADLKARPDRTKAGERWQHNRRARESYHAIRECTNPVIASIKARRSVRVLLSRPRATFSSSPRRRPSACPRSTWGCSAAASTRSACSRIRRCAA
jgi:hypothetical protein